jgi:hypothetical protein
MIMGAVVVMAVVDAGAAVAVLSLEAWSRERAL